MKNLSSNIVRLFFCFSLLLFFNISIQAQADCDGPGNFAVTLDDGTPVTGGLDDPFVVCQDQILNFTSEGASPTLGFPNPGIVFAIYTPNPPEDTDPTIDPNNIGVGFTYTNEDGDQSLIVNEGSGTFFTSEIDSSVTVCIVPIIVPDVADSTSYDENCSGVNPDFDYPCVTLLNPEVYPNCTLEEPDCEASAGTLDVGTLYCGEAIEAIGADFNETEEYAHIYILTDTDLNITALSFDGTFEAESGVYIVHALNVEAAEIAEVDPADLIGLNAADVLAGLECFELVSAEENTIVTEQFEMSFNFDAGCSPVTNEPILTIVIDGASEEYSLSGDIEGSFPNDTFPFDLVVQNGLVFEITATDDLGCSATITGEAPTCEPNDTCAASSGVLTFAEFVCGGDALEIFAVAGNMGINYTQLFVLTDTDLNIIDVNGTGSFEAEAGTYLGHGLNVLTSEIDGLNPADLIGLNALDVLDGLDCYDLQTSGNIVVLNPMGTVLETECFDETGVVSVTFSFTGGLPEYAIENGFPDPDGFFYTVGGFIEAELSPEDFFFAEAVENQVYELIITDALGCITEITDTLPNCVKECDASTGTFEFDEDAEYCAGDELIIVADGFQEDEGYQQWYVLADSDFIITEANMSGEFTIPDPGNYSIYVYNIEGELDETDFVGGNVVVLAFECFDFAGTPVFSVINCVDPTDPIEINDIEYVVDSLTSSYIVTFEISGGTGVYEVTSGTVDVNTFTSSEVDCGTDLLVTVTDDEGNSFETTLDAPCDEIIIVPPVEFSCEDYPIEISVDYSCNSGTGVYTLTYAFSGGLPQYAAENGSANPDDYFYEVTGDLQGSFDVENNNHTIEYTDATAFSLSIVDNGGCTADTTGLPDPCVKTSVELIEFEGKPIEEGNDISWITASEQKSSHFVLQRSYNEIDFDNIAQINAAGESNTTIEYQILDDGVTAQTSYYRLISVDQEGTEEQSNVITVVRPDELDSNIGPFGPVPGKDKIIFSTSIIDVQNFEIHIFDPNGKEVGGGRPAPVNGQYELDISQYPAGIYFFQLTDGKTSDIVKFIKQ